MALLIRFSDQRTGIKVPLDMVATACGDDGGVGGEEKSLEGGVEPAEEVYWTKDGHGEDGDGKVAWKR
ncbi:hypothetical protein E4U55_002731 [Claviceps digitariae]|nr:hypothetical protein E4U55_002731 [Claviceps digitariae]